MLDPGSASPWDDPATTRGPGFRLRVQAADLRLLLGRLIQEEAGQDVIEYGILIATIAVVVLLATTAFGNQITVWFGSLATRITTTGTG